MRRAARIASVPVAHILSVCGFEACHPVDNGNSYKRHCVEVC